MKTIKIKLYEFHNLNKEVKKRIVKRMWANLPIANQSMVYTFTNLATHFNFKDYKNIGGKWHNGSFKIKINDTYHLVTEEMVQSLGRYNPDTLCGYGDCVLTGHWFDEEAIDAVRQAFYKGEANTSKLLQIALEALNNAGVKDYKSQCSDDYMNEYCFINNLFFLKDGTIFNFKKLDGAEYEVL